MAVSQIGGVWSPIRAMAKVATASAQLFKTIGAEILDTSDLKAPNVQAQTIFFSRISLLLTQAVLAFRSYRT